MFCWQLWKKKNQLISAVPKDPKMVLCTQALHTTCKKHVGFDYNRIMKTSEVEEKGEEKG